MNTEKWIIDPAHSELGFKIKHLMISNVSGYIKDFYVEVETAGNDFSSASISMGANMSNISTNDEKRDAHLRSHDFFDTDNFPELKFRSTEIKKEDDDTFIVHGQLTMKGITKPVALTVDFGGIAHDAHGNDKAGFEIAGKINRSEWGLNFNRVLDSGGLGLGEFVKIFSNLQLIKEAKLTP